MKHILEIYEVFYDGKTIGYYHIFDDGTVMYRVALGSPQDMEQELKELGLDKEQEREQPIRIFAEMINDKNRVGGRKRVIYQAGLLKLERKPKETNERFSVYRRSAEEGEPDYSPFPHDAPHYEGSKSTEGMREWASWYAFNKLDDGTYEAELDEAWCWGGGYNEGGTIHREIPEEWFELSYEDFLCHVVTLSAASHYGFTAEMLKEKEGLREFFEFE